MNNEVGNASLARPQVCAKTALLFEQQPRESAKAFAAFVVYRDLGPGRTQAETARRIGKSASMVGTWSQRHDWTTRVKAYAIHMAAVEQAAREAVARQHVTDWSKRQDTLREEEWAMHDECIRAGRAALEQFTAKGRAATLSEIARILELASKLGRLASGLATDKTEVSSEDAQFMLTVEMALNKVYGPENGGQKAEDRGQSIVEVEAVPEKQKAEIGKQKEQSLLTSAATEAKG